MECSEVYLSYQHDVGFSEALEDLLAEGEVGGAGRGGAAGAGFIRPLILEKEFSAMPFINNPHGNPASARRPAAVWRLGRRAAQGLDVRPALPFVWGSKVQAIGTGEGGRREGGEGGRRGEPAPPSRGGSILHPEGIF